MKNLSYVIWDKEMPVNGVEAKKVRESLRISDENEVYIIMDGKRAWIVQTDKNTPFPADDIEVSAQLHLNSLRETSVE